MAITYLLKTSALRMRIIQDGKLLIFNTKVSDPSAVLRRSLGDHFIVTFPFSTTVEKNILPFEKKSVSLQFEKNNGNCTVKQKKTNANP